MSAAPLGEWFGVTTDHAGRVRGLDLSDNGLAGSLPRELGSLENLQALRLDWNDLTGPIPDTLGSLVNLGSLSLSFNELTGSLPRELGSLVNLQTVWVGGNDFTGPIPRELGNLRKLVQLNLARNDLTGRIPRELGSLVNLRFLYLSRNWSLSGPLPPVGQFTRLEKVHIELTQACAPAGWWDRAVAIELKGGRPCETGADTTIDIAVFYTPAAREAAGGPAAIRAVVDLMVAETNQAYAESGVHHRLALVDRSEVDYIEAGDSWVDYDRLADPSDGHMDEVHSIRDRVGADLVHLIFEAGTVGGRAGKGSAFGISCRACGGVVFAHETGHNMWLEHDRYVIDEDWRRAHPAYGYVNQAGLVAGAAESRRWRTIMAYPNQCDDVNTECPQLLRFSNARQHHHDDPLGVAYGYGGSGLTGPADAAAVLNSTSTVVALWRDRPFGANLPPMTVGGLPDKELTGLQSTLEVEVATAFSDPDGDPLTYAASSMEPRVVAVATAGAGVTLTATGVGVATVTVTATDPGGLSATQGFTVTVNPPGNRPPEAVGVLPPLTIGLDEDAVSVGVSGVFRDPDGDGLSYGATSSSPGVATVAVSGGGVTVTPVSAGAATVTVTATDPGGLSARQSFTVTVNPPGNRPPEAVGVLPPLTIGLDEDAVSVGVSGVFRRPGRRRVELRGDLVVAGGGDGRGVGWRRDGGAGVGGGGDGDGDGDGPRRPECHARLHGDGEPARLDRPPEAVGVLPPLTIGLDEDAVSVGVSGVFRDPDGDGLSYGATSNVAGGGDGGGVGGRRDGDAGVGGGGDGDGDGDGPRRSECQAELSR